MIFDFRFSIDHVRHTIISGRNRIPFLSATFFVFFFSIGYTPVAAQTADQALLVNRLCKTWRIEKIVQGDSAAGADNALNDFVLIIQADHTVQQGMYPDGLIKGTWTLDEKNRVFTVKDSETSSVYPMKILSITADEMVIQDQASATSLTIYYKAK